MTQNIPYHNPSEIIKKLLKNTMCIIVLQWVPSYRCLKGDEAAEAADELAK